MQDVELALFNREFDVLWLLEVVLQFFAHFDQLLVDVRHFVDKRVDMVRRSLTRHNVLTLRVNKVIAVQSLFTCLRVASEHYAGAAVASRVAKDHRDNGDRRAASHVRSDVILLAIFYCALASPRTEHRVDGELQLFVRVRRKLFARIFAKRLERICHSLDHFGA